MSRLNQSDRTTATIGAVCGYVFVTMLGLGLIVPGWIPPPGPGRSADQVAAAFAGDQTRIRIACLLISFGIGFLLPFVTAMSTMLRRIGPQTEHLALVQLVGGVLASISLLLPVTFWEVAAFRPERDPELTRLANDLAWLPFAGIVTFFLVQEIAIAAAILLDRSEDPLFPRWAGYLSLWTALLLMPASMDIFWAHGPFAWNGLITFWIALVVFGVWWVVMIGLLFMFGRKPRDLEPTPTTTTPTPVAVP